MSATTRAAQRWGLDPFAQRTPRTDVCNTRSEDSYCPPAPRIGVDTVSFCWSDPDAVDRLLRLEGFVPRGEHRPLRIIPAPGGAVRVSQRLAGLGQVGAFPGASMLFVEGRARALERRDEQDHGLGRPAVLDVVKDQVANEVSELLGARPHGRIGVRRVDLTGELRFDRGEDGRELLALLDALHSPRHKSSPVRERGGPGIETAYWRTPKRSVPVLRAYDKGVESGTAAPGERIRVERQIRFGSGKRPTVAQLLDRDLPEMFIAPIRTWLTGGLAIGTAGALIKLLTDAAVIWPTYWSAGSSWASGTGRVHVSLWPARKVERVLGTLAVVDAYGAAWPAWSLKQRQRRLREVRELGLLLTDKPVVVDVDHAINQLCELWKAA